MLLFLVVTMESVSVPVTPGFNGHASSDENYTISPELPVLSPLFGDKTMIALMDGNSEDLEMDQILIEVANTMF